VYVVDTGVARVNRYGVRTGVSQLLIEPVSKASLDICCRRTVMVHRHLPQADIIDRVSMLQRTEMSVSHLAYVLKALPTFDRNKIR
jgi:hypothetical protein